MQGQYHNARNDFRMMKSNPLQNHGAVPLPDVAMPSHLPPLSMLPQWNRVNTLDKSRYPKPFIRDRMPPQPVGKGEGEDQTTETEMSNMDPAQKATYLERSIKFLKQQHQDILKCLHEEIDIVKKENKDLQFRLVMNEKRKNSARKDKDGGSDEQTEVDDSTSFDTKYIEGTEKSREVRVIFLNEEIKELKHALREAVNANTYLKQLVEQREEQIKRQNMAIDKLKEESIQAPQTALMAEQVVNGENLFSPKSSSQPTLSECQGIIKHLQQVNEKQSHELEGLKSDLRDVLYSHKWTPDAYLLAKAYVAEDDNKEMSGENKSSKSALPRIPLKHPTRKLPDEAYVQRDIISLPALKHTVGNKATERQKRAQIIQKARYKEELLK